MHPTSQRLVRVIPRTLLKVSEQKIYTRPIPQSQDRLRPTLIDVLIKQQQAAGEAWPQNLRLERQLKKEAYRKVRPEVRSALKSLTKER
ncbi:hypothetical protein B0H34DRAFT_411810 [Crassisporium funariophilum]|nr:hypothetical protein B0H34DRAFT_411810 [Crassisporium funariophilum]